MKKICFVTAARSEYGLLKWIMKAVRDSKIFDFSLIVTGAHLQAKYGHSIDQIIEDGFEPNYVIEYIMDNSSSDSIVNEMGTAMTKFSAALKEINPDYILLLGDRYELLAIASAALIMRIPIIHLSGGDVTKGAIDDNIRNAVTMMATYHFPGNKESADNIIRMRGSSENIWNIGEPGLDAFFKEKLMTRTQLAQELNIDVSKKWILMTFHPETMKSIEYNIQGAVNCIESLLSCTDGMIVATYANADLGGNEINNYLETVANENPQRIRVIPSLGQKRYLSFMKEASFVIGNSSSGIVEAPVLRIPVINVGDRQLGRHICKNVLNSDISKEAICKAIDKINNINPEDMLQCDYEYWGKGNTAEKFMEIITAKLR